MDRGSMLVLGAVLRINVTNFGPRAACLSPLEEQRTFIILATVSGKTHQRLRAHYDHPGSAAVQWSKENEEEVWRALAKRGVIEMIERHCGRCMGGGWEGGKLINVLGHEFLSE
ncbi:hypothetical protein Pcinc_020151 [Petrolisthes cinctipes]|uniref:Uncharacterized protein n=1 Tax=Petrolisthes cinctipes TaxID=88211 RepID=A0AAE1FIR1_PETCI|nr:hypothetical protein Pcinc_020151 [Petrolisthes cinctipes]